MPINMDKPHLWKIDIAKSVDMYNDWFMNFAPKAFRETRIKTSEQVKGSLTASENLTNITPGLFKRNPSVLPMLRMSTCPPIARDRLVGLSGVSKNLVESMENSKNPRVPPNMPESRLESELKKISALIIKMADPDIFVWLGRVEPATNIELERAATIVADRLCGAISDPIIRNAQERRQLEKIEKWLLRKGYMHHNHKQGLKFNEMLPGTFAFRMNVPVNKGEEVESQVNIPVDAVIMPLKSSENMYPILIEAKSAGDFTNVNKRRKEESKKMIQLKNTYGENVQFGLFLCGYFDSGYLGYEAADGIDWVWEHRIDDLASFGL